MQQGIAISRWPRQAEPVAPRLSALRDEPILFAHRGASAHAPDNTIEAFELAVTLGATGIESDVWITADGHAVLDHDGHGGGIRRRPIARMARAKLAEHVPTLAEALAVIPSHVHVSLDIKDSSAIDAVIDTVRAVEERTGNPTTGRTWLCHPDLDLLVAWRARWPDVRLVHSTKLGALTDGPERHGASLYRDGIDAVNFRHRDWSGGLTALYHRFGVFCFGWDAQLERISAELLNVGLDAIYGNHVDRLVAAHQQIYGA